MCVCVWVRVYLQARNQHNNIKFLLFFRVLLCSFLPTHNVIVITGSLENSKAGTQSKVLTSQKVSGKLKRNETKLTKNELLIWTDTLQQRLSRTIKTFHYPNISAQCEGFSPKIMSIPNYWYSVTSISVGKPIFQWRQSKWKKTKGPDKSVSELMEFAKPSSRNYL